MLTARVYNIFYDSLENIGYHAFIKQSIHSDDTVTSRPLLRIDNIELIFLPIFRTPMLNMLTI